MKLPDRLTSHSLNTIETAMAFAAIGILVAFVWNEATVRVFLLGPLFIKYGISTKFILTLMQVWAAACTIVSAILAVYIGAKILRAFSISRNAEVASIAAFLWGIVLFSYEIPTLEGNFFNPHSNIVLLALTGARIGVDLLSCGVYWYWLKRTLRKMA